MRKRPLALTAEYDLPIERLLVKNPPHHLLRIQSCLPATIKIKQLLEQPLGSLCLYSWICKLGLLMHFLPSELNALNKGAIS